MTISFMLALSFGLAVDAFAVATTIGMTSSRSRGQSMWPFVVYSTVVSFVFVLTGTHLGSELGVTNSAWNDTLIGCILLLLGSSLGDTNAEESESHSLARTHCKLFTASLIVNLDSGICGFGIEAADAVSFAAVLTIVTAILSTVGFTVGAKLGNSFRKNARRVGAWILIVLGCVKIVS